MSKILFFDVTSIVLPKGRNSTVKDLSMRPKKKKKPSVPEFAPHSTYFVRNCQYPESQTAS
jgi:hypothetical protein